MQQSIRVVLAASLLLTGCAPRATKDALTIRAGRTAYEARMESQVTARAAGGGGPRAFTCSSPPRHLFPCSPAHLPTFPPARPAAFALAATWADVPPPATQPTATQPTLPPGYWRKNVWHQMGHEAKDFGGRGFWSGFKTAYWDVENLLVLTAAMGASVTIRETGVDDTIRGRTWGHRQLGDADEPIQLLGHPGTHFAAAGVLWLSSTLTKDAKEHELAKTLGQALAVNGVSTMLLKVAANTEAPNGDELAWPSGHTSSSFTVAAVLNEHYGPLVGAPSLALASLVGYQRIDSRVHDFSDVVFGAVLGYVIGSSIAKDNKGELPELFGMKVLPYADPQTGATGIALMKQW